MTQRDGFAGGFFAGAIVGSIIGGVIGTLVAQRRDSAAELAEDRQENQITATGNSNFDKSAKGRQMADAASGVEMEIARRSLEDKIAQLNATIDEVRDQLSNVNKNSGEVNQYSSRSEELQS